MHKLADDTLVMDETWYLFLYNVAQQVLPITKNAPLIISSPIGTVNAPLTLTGLALGLANLSGDVTTPSGSLVATIAANAVTNAKAAQMAAKTIKGNNAAGAANPADLTATQALALLGIGSQITNSLLADVALNNTANYFDGPSVAQGSIGTWFVSGTVTLINTTNSDKFNCKLWDGTTVIASAATLNVSTFWTTVSLSGFITSPAGNLRISVNDPSRTTGVMLFNASGNSKDSTITAFRIA